MLEGAPLLEGTRILDKRRYAAQSADHIRRLVVNEPRGHADMYGCFVTDPEDPEGDIGVVFFHNAGYSTACGHGTIALVTWAIESGRVGPVQATTRVVVDAPSGRLETFATVEDGRVRSVRFRNVPSFVLATDIELETSRGPLRVDIAFGGAFYASVHAPDAGLQVDPSHLNDLIALGREVKQMLEASQRVVHPLEPELEDVYGVVFFETVASRGGLQQKNVTIFADGEVDRSPCGSGTSARLALLHSHGELATGDPLVHEGIVGTRFIGVVTEEIELEGRPGVITEVEGSAYLTGEHTFILTDGDPLPSGFVLR